MRKNGNKLDLSSGKNRGNVGHHVVRSEDANTTTSMAAQDEETKSARGRPLDLMAATQGNKTGVMAAMVVGPGTMAGLWSTMGKESSPMQGVHRLAWSQCTVQTDTMPGMEGHLPRSMGRLVGPSGISGSEMAGRIKGPRTMDVCLLTDPKSAID